MPQLGVEAVEELEADITLEEIKTTIMQSPNNKTPGPDGFIAEFYKEYSEILAPLLLCMFQYIKENGAFSQALYQANIVLLPKKDRDPNNVSSYRPVSLLPFETKLSTIFANRLESHIAKIVHPDQNGFIPNRRIFFYLR